MNLRIGSEILFALGRRYPRLPVAFLRAMPLPVLRALRAPAFRETRLAAARAPAYRRLAEYRFNVVVSDPFWLARLTEIARERGRPGPMKLLIGGGEGITERVRAELESFWGALLCMTYASTEAATILAFECTHRAGYHVNEFDFCVEIVDADSEGYGEIVLTTVSRSVMPLVRYRTGDVARWLPEPCPCGLAFRRLSPLRGRLDEQVSCAWGNLHPEFFEPLLREVSGLASDWQVAVYERELPHVVQLRLELD